MNDKQLNYNIEKIYTPLLELLDDFSIPINLNKNYFIEERTLKLFIFTALEKLKGNAFSKEQKDGYKQLSDDFIQYLKTQGVERKDNIFYGIGKLPEEEMVRRFGEPYYPIPGKTFFADRHNRLKPGVKPTHWQEEIKKKHEELEQFRVKESDDIYARIKKRKENQ